MKVKTETVSNVSQQNTEAQDKVIRFNMKDDDKVREIARKGYSVAKHFKEVGLKFKKVIPAVTDLSVRKLFKLPPDSDLLSLEIDFNGKTEEEKKLIIEDIKDTLLILEDYSLVDEKQYMYDKTNIVYRFLLKHQAKAQKSK